MAAASGGERRRAAAVQGDMQWRGDATLAAAERGPHEVACAALAGARLATGGGCALHTWRWAPGAGWRRAGEAPRAHRYGVTCAAWARGATLLASGGVDGCVRVWSGAGAGGGAGGGAVPLRALAAPGAAAVRALRWAGGARLAAAHEDGALRVWAARGALLARLAARDAALHALAFAARDSLLVTLCAEGVLKVYDFAAVCGAGEAEGEGAEVAPLQWEDGAHDLGALCAAADEEAGGALLATGGHDALVRLWRVAEWGAGVAGVAAGARLEAGGTLEGHAAAVTALHWARGVLASASLDRTARLWAAGGACLQVVAAHERYLTCVQLDAQLRFMVTGSNDKSFRTWALGSFSLDDEVEPPCEVLAHFGLGDLEGIAPIDEEEEEAVESEGAGEEEGGAGVTRVWTAQAHSAAINCISARGDLIVTASSDGTVGVWRVAEGGATLERRLAADGYPVLAAALGAGGALVAAGLGGGARVWAAREGVAVRALAVPGAGAVRAAALSPHRAPLLLLATDAGLAPLWALADPDPHPLRVYAAHAEACTCCAWSGDGRVAATAAEGGELRLLAPPAADHLYHRADAHDLGVLSCDFAPPCSEIDLPEGSYLLATAGRDSFIKFWRIDLQEGGGGAEVCEVRRVEAHGGAAAALRWGGRGALASGGADRWARVWRVAGGARGVSVAGGGAAPVRAAGGAPSVAWAARGALLAVGDLDGALTLWAAPAAAEAGPAPDEDADGADWAAPRLWRAAAVRRWLRDHVLDAPGSPVSAAGAAALTRRVARGDVTGAALLGDPPALVLRRLGLEDENDSNETEDDDTQAIAEIQETAEDEKTTENDEVKEAEVTLEIEETADIEETEQVEEVERAATRALVLEELRWLRAAPPPAHVEAVAPHALLCPLTHRVMREPARAADGCSYERAALAEWLLAAPPGRPARSPRTARRLANCRVHINYALRDQLRAFLAAHASSSPSPPSPPSAP